MHHNSPHEDPDSHWMQGTQKYELRESHRCGGVPCDCENSKEPKVTVSILEIPLTATVTIEFLNQKSH